MSSEKTKTRKLTRGAKFLLLFGGALVIYAVTGFLVVPAVVKSQMLKRLPLMLKRPVTVAGVKVNPFTFSATVNGFAVLETNGSAFAGFDQFFATLNFASGVRRGWFVGEISLTHPFAHLVRGKDEKLNFEDILAALGSTNSAPAPAPAAKTPLPLVLIDSLHIDNADIEVDDFVPARPVHAKILPIHLKLDHLSTAGGAHNPYEITAESDSHETFQWTGAFTLDPPQVTGSLLLKQIDLKKYSPYLGKFANAELLDGRLDVKADYTAGLGTNGPEVSVEKGEVYLQSLSLKSTLTGETVVTFPSFSLSLSEASLGKKLVHLNSIKSSGGSLLVRREPDGKINLLTLLKQAPSAAPSTNATAAAAIPWAASVDQIAIDDYTLHIEDNQPAQPAKLTVDQIAFKAKGFSTVSNAPLELDLAVRLGDTGHFATHGVVHLQPPSAELTLSLTNLDLRPFQPYVQQQVKLAVTSGQFSLQGSASYNAGQSAPRADFTGDLSVAHFATADLLHFRDFVKLDDLSVTGIKFAFQPNSLEIGEVRLSGLSTSVAVDAGKNINLLTVLPAQPAPAAHAAPSPSPAAPLDFPLSLAKFTLDNASFHFSDQSIEPNCLFDLQQLDGAVTGLSSRTDSRATVDLRGKVDDVSTFSIVGSANPLSKDLSVDVAIDCQNVNLTPFTPYMEKFGGYPLQRGKLLVDLKEKVAGGRLVSSNHVVVAGLTLGAKNHSPDATHLPVKLGVALLKDRNGNITLDVPLSGQLDSPDFRIVPIALQVLQNLLVKAATSPFSMLGSMFGSGDELSFMDFQPGLAEIPATEQAKLDKLAKALYERPALQLEITAGADPLADSPVLARLRLADKIRALRVQELIAAGAPPETAQSVQVEPTNYARLLQSLYTQTIATNLATNLVVSNVEMPAISLAAPTNSPATAATPAHPVSRPAISSAARRNTPGPIFHGAELMVEGTSVGSAMKNWSVEPPPAQPRALSHPVAPTPVSTNLIAAVTPPPTPADNVTPDQMEAALLEQIHVTPDDLRELMQARARSVQAALVKSGKVEADRLFILAPQPVSLDTKGQSRANLALE